MSDISNELQIPRWHGNIISKYVHNINFYWMEYYWGNWIWVLTFGTVPRSRTNPFSLALWCQSWLVLLSFSSQAWSCWPWECGGRWAWRPISPRLLRTAPRHHMSSLGPEPSSLFSDCLVALLHAAAAHGCSNWSVTKQKPLRYSPQMSNCITVFLVLFFVSMQCFWSWCSWLSLRLVSPVSSSDMRWSVSAKYNFFFKCHSSSQNI